MNTTEVQKPFLGGEINLESQTDMIEILMTEVKLDLMAVVLSIPPVDMQMKNPVILVLYLPLNLLAFLVSLDFLYEPKKDICTMS